MNFPARLLRRTIELFVGMSAVAAASAGALAQPTQWTQVQHIGPAARTGAAMVYDSARGVLVLFGGRDDVSVPIWYRDTWEWDGATWALRTETGPQIQHGHAMAFDSARSRTVMVGYAGETWEWDGAVWTNRLAAGPVRLRAACAYDAARGETVVFGGLFGTVYDSQDQPAADTWVWNGTSWTRRTTGGPPARAAACMAYDASRQKCVLYGGISGVMNPTYFGDTWEWNGTTWTQRAVAGPPARYAAAMAYDSTRSRVVVFGGWLGAGGEGADTWEFDGTQWMQTDANGLSARNGMSMAYDAPRDRMVLFSGNHLPPYEAGAFSTGQPGDTWALQEGCSAPAFTLQPLTQRTCAGGSITLAVQAGPGPISYQWRQGHPRVPMPGQTGPTLTVSTFRPPFSVGSAADYDCVVWNTCGSALSTSATATGCYTDFDCNGRTEIADIFAFLRAWFAGDIRADAYNNGVLEVNDVFAFISYFMQNPC